MMKILLKLFLIFLFVFSLFTFLSSNSYAQVCGGSGRCGTYVQPQCTNPIGDVCFPGTQGCVCPDAYCDYSSAVNYSCSFNTILNACSPNYPQVVTECLAGGCGQNNCTTSYPTCDTGLSCGSWNVECGTATRTCTYTTYSGGGTCTQDSFIDTDTILCPTGEYCSTNTCVSYCDISGTVFIDSNQDGVSEGTKASVSMTRSGGASTTTNSSGNYAFNNNTQATYTVGMSLPSGFDTKPGTNSSYSVVCNSPSKDQDFWISDVSSITVHVIKDFDHNGATDPGDTDFSGIGVTIAGNSLTTNTAGDATETGLFWGNRSTSITIPSGWQLVNSPNQKTTNLGQNNVTVNYYLTPLYDIPIGAYVDTDNDFSTGNTTIPSYTSPSNKAERAYGGGLLVRLMQAGVEIKRITTNASGQGTISGVRSGNYNLVFDTPAGFEFKRPTIGTTCSPPNCRGQVTNSISFSTTGPDNDKSRDFAFYELNTCDISGKVFIDTNGDGTRQTSEAWWNSAGSPLALAGGPTAKANVGTDANGQYTFSSLDDGTYRVSLTVPSGYEASNTNNNFTCSPASCQGTATLTGIDIPPNSTNNNFALHPLSATPTPPPNACKFMGTIYVDTDFDGAANRTYGGGAGAATVNLRQGGNLLASDAGGQSGAYSIPNTYPAGTYRTQLDLPTGYINISPSDGVNNGLTCPTGGGNIVSNFIIRPPGYTISGLVWNDTDRDGIKDASESVRSNNSVTLTRSGTTVATLTTNASGNYTSATLPAGTYSVTVSVPTNYQVTTPPNPRSVTIGPNTTVNFGLAASSATVSTNPTSITINPTSTTGTTTVTWSYTGPSADVCQTVNGVTSLFAAGGTAGASHSQSATIGANTYTFSVRTPANNCLGTTIGSTVITGTQTYMTSGNIYIDTNGNGAKDTGESNYSGAQISVCGTNYVSDASGNYITYPPTRIISGTNCTVSLSVPSGYASTTTNPRSVTLGPNATVNFGIRPSYTVTANALVDNSLNNCASGATTYSGGSIIFTLVDTVTSISRSTPAPGVNPATYQFTSVLPNSQQISMGVPSGYRINDIGITPGSGTRVGNTLSFTPNANQVVNFCITDSISWFQVNQGDVRFPKLIDEVPSGQVAGAGNNSVFFSSTYATPDLGDGGAAVGNPDKWVVKDEYSKNSNSKSTLGSLSYSFYKNRAAKNGVEIIPLSSVAGNDCDVNGDCTLPVLPTGIYETSGNINITGVDGGSDETNHVVLLVNGSAQISGNITTGSSAVFILAAKGDLTIDKSVGTTAGSSTIQLSGFYTSEGNIVVDGDGPSQCASGTSDKRLNVEGALVANALYPFSDSGAGKVTINRSLCTSDSTSPSLYVTMKPSFFTQLTDFYKVTNKRWVQVQP